MPPECEQEQTTRLHQRIDEVQHTCSEILEALTYDRAKSRPGVLPRLDALEAINAANQQASMRSWLFDMGTYVLKVMLAAGAMYLAASAKRGIVLDLSGRAVSNVIDVVSDNHQQMANK